MCIWKTHKNKQNFRHFRNRWGETRGVRRKRKWGFTGSRALGPNRKTELEQEGFPSTPNINWGVFMNSERISWSTPRYWFSLLWFNIHNSSTYTSDAVVQCRCLHPYPSLLLFTRSLMLIHQPIIRCTYLLKENKTVQRVFIAMKANGV